MSLPRRQFAWQCLGLSAATLAAAGPPPALPEVDANRPEPTMELLILSALVQRYPSEHYTPEVLRGIYGDMVADLARGQTLRSFPLKNSDEPANPFRVYRAGPDGAP